MISLVKLSYTTGIKGSVCNSVHVLKKKFANMVVPFELQLHVVTRSADALQVVTLLLVEKLYVRLLLHHPNHRLPFFLLFLFLLLGCYPCLLSFHFYFLWSQREQLDCYVGVGFEFVDGLYF